MDAPAGGAGGLAFAVEPDEDAARARAEEAEVSSVVWPRHESGTPQGRALCGCMRSSWPRPAAAAAAAAVASAWRRCQVRLRCACVVPAGALTALAAPRPAPCSGARRPSRRSGCRARMMMMMIWMTWTTEARLDSLSGTPSDTEGRGCSGLLQLAAAGRYWASLTRPPRDSLVAGVLPFCLRPAGRQCRSGPLDDQNNASLGWHDRPPPNARSQERKLMPFD